MNANLVPMREAVRRTGLHPNTLRRYFDSGKIEGRRAENGNRLFNIDQFCGAEQQRSGVVCYARVSSPKQKDDLARQVAAFRKDFPDSEIIQDIGSGLNWKRKGLRTLLDRVLRGDKLTVIVAHRDRLARFGFELIEYLVSRRGGEIVVLNKSEGSAESELAEDIIAILHVFSCRINGRRRYKNKEDKTVSERPAT